MSKTCVIKAGNPKKWPPTPVLLQAAKSKAERLAEITARVQASMLATSSIPVQPPLRAPEHATLQSSQPRPASQLEAAGPDPRPSIRLIAPASKHQAADQLQDPSRSAQSGGGSTADSPSQQPHCAVPLPVNIRDLEDDHSWRQMDLIAAGSLGGGPGTAAPQDPELSRMLEMLLQTRWQRWRQQRCDLLQEAATAPQQPSLPGAGHCCTL